ncbi:hypothetical protein HN51_036593 [Arachis hypogaea]
MQNLQGLSASPLRSKSCHPHHIAWSSLHPIASPFFCHVKFTFCFDIYKNINKIKKFKSLVLVIHVKEKSSVEKVIIDEIVKFIKESYPNNESGIVYCFSRKECDKYL